MRLEHVADNYERLPRCLTCLEALAGPATSGQGRKPAEPGAQTARALTGGRGPGQLVISRLKNSSVSACDVYCRGCEWNVSAIIRSLNQTVSQRAGSRHKNAGWLWDY